MRLNLSNIDNVFRAQPGNVEIMEAMGFELIDTAMADNSGFGMESEPADTPDQLRARVRQLIEQHGSITAKIIGVGMFQVRIGFFTKTGVKTGRKLASNVYLLTINGKRVVRLYDTDIATENGDGTLTLNTGGFNTNTTSKRLNEFTNLNIYRKNWVMRVGTYGNDDPAFENDKITVPGSLRV